MLKVSRTILIEDSELEERFVRASGPGGQHVNKVATAVELRFDVMRSPSLSDAIRRRLALLAGRRMTDEGILVIRAERFRSQERNREDARTRLAELISQAATPIKHRIKTKPTQASKRRRLDTKAKRGALKRNRSVRDLD